jgi:hypothetical protein
MGPVQKKGRQRGDCLPGKAVRGRSLLAGDFGSVRVDHRLQAGSYKQKDSGSDVGLRLAEAHDAVARLPLAAFPQNLDALEALEDVAFDDEAAGALEAFVLGHGV